MVEKKQKKGQNRKNKSPLARHNLTKKIQSIELQKKAYEMRIDGWRTKDIAEKLDITQTHTCKLIRVALDEAKEHNRELAEKLRDIELDSLQKLQPTFFARALDGDDDALISILKIMERRAKLTGMDVKEPLTVDVAMKGYEMLGELDWPKSQKEQDGETK